MSSRLPSAWIVERPHWRPLTCRVRLALVVGVVLCTFLVAASVAVVARRLQALPTLRAKSRFMSPAYSEARREAILRRLGPADPVEEYAEEHPPTFGR